MSNQPTLTNHPYRALAGVLALFLGLALLYNWASPLFENSDEFFHFPFIKHLADSNGYLPVQSGDDLQDWRQQGSQPPAYHMLAALLIKPLDTSDYEQARRINPHAQIGVVGESNINAVLHPLDRSAEFKGGTAWAVRLVRLFSTLLAGVVVVATYFMTVYTFPQVPRWVGVLAAALVAFNPMYVFVASSINNDNLSNAMIASVLAILVWLYRRESRPPIPIFFIIGLCLGLSMLSKLSTGPFMLLVGLFWLFIAHKKKAWAYMVRWGVMTLGLALLISGWWYIRNWQLYGDPSGLNVFLDIVGRRPIALTSEQLWSERVGFIQAFWGLFGGLTVPMADWVYTGFNLLAGLSLLGAVLYGVRQWRHREDRSPAPHPAPTGKNWLATFDLPQAVLVVWPVMAFISLIRWTSLTWASQGRLWYIALTALAALSAVGFYELARRLNRPALATLPALYALGIALLAPFVWIRPAYAVPDLSSIETVSESDVLTAFQDPDHPQESLWLVAAEVPAQASAGDTLPIHLDICAATPLTRNWSVFVHLVNEWDIILAQADFTPGLGAIPTSELSGGECWQDRYPIQIEAGIAPDDLTLSVLVGFYEASTNTRMLYSPDGAERFPLAEVALDVGNALQKFVLGERVRINRYDLSQSVIERGQPLTLTINWEVLAPFDDDYTAFVQVINPTTAYRAAAADLPHPTRTWTGLIPESYPLTIAEDAPPGVYAVIVGFYQRTEDGGFARLRLAYDGTDTGFDYITLTQVRIE